MTRLPARGMLVVIAFLGSACGREQPRTAPAGEPKHATMLGAADRQGAPDAALSAASALGVADDVSGANATSGAADAQARVSAVDVGPGDGASSSAATSAEADAVLAPSAADAVAAGSGFSPDAERPTPSVVTPLPELCRQACENAHRLVLTELPTDTAPAMREEVERALERDCPGRCLQRASVESARCIAGAKSALELAACQ